MRQATHPVEIRVAEEDDLPRLLHLDDSYTSTHTWQVEVVRGEPGAPPYPLNSNVTLGESPVSVTFRPVKLSRPRKVHGPVVTALREGNESFYASRLQAWGSADLVLVAEQGTKVAGYLVLMAVPGSRIGWISALVVASSLRRHGIGSMLLAAARRWARYGHGTTTGISAFMCEASVKNFPAVAFCRKEGFNLCGYTDYSFSSGDLVLMFVSPVVI